ncbi:transglycosylase domain-containing protein [Massiliimalia timonensis]|uniref:transglycosylase domain-containing protein n=1 Tax=Massiliimalia timonensis TaxID=1987501 RepID=UPI000B8AE76B|nr:biosynthetic peptidoglycan transglycosylase [Massiliimalia timonensis]MBS7175885.1 transglycosylase domain-containing protein [Clostridiales bacterium]
MRIRKFLQGFFLLLFVIALVAGSIFLYRGYKTYDEAYQKTSLDEMAQTVYDTPGFTPLEELPEIYLDAVVAVEDHRFYTHSGIDFIAICRALWNDVRTLSLAEGGSTITQQTAKNLYFTQDRTPTRKVAEIFMAFQLEKHFSKEEILELYVNSIYFGNGYYGIGKASEGFFGKTPDKLTDSECTMLAGIPNAPSAYAPTANPKLAQERQRQVLRRMVDEECLSQEQADNILKQE